jgi:hypothetical protein
MNMFFGADNNQKALGDFIRKTFGVRVKTPEYK